MNHYLIARPTQNLVMWSYYINNVLTLSTHNQYNIRSGVASNPKTIL
jgi:hypothetical protein